MRLILIIRRGDFLDFAVLPYLGIGFGLSLALAFVLTCCCCGHFLDLDLVNHLGQSLVLAFVRVFLGSRFLTFRCGCFRVFWCRSVLALGACHLNGLFIGDSRHLIDQRALRRRTRNGDLRGRQGRAE